jgi:DNA-directed RNA polymerase specialized sigma24 family protein
VGAELSFDDLYRASYARMVRLAWLLVGSLPAAEDVVHDAFLAVHERWGSVADPATPGLRAAGPGRRRGAAADR